MQNTRTALLQYSEFHADPGRVKELMNQARVGVVFRLSILPLRLS